MENNSIEKDSIYGVLIMNDGPYMLSTSDLKKLNDYYVNAKIEDKKIYINYEKKEFFESLEIPNIDSIPYYKIQINTKYGAVQSGMGFETKVSQTTISAVSLIVRNYCVNNKEKMLQLFNLIKENEKDSNS